MALRRYQMPVGPREKRYKAPASSPNVEARIHRARARRGALLLSEVAWALGVSVATVRMYERRGWVRVRRPRPTLALIKRRWVRKLVATLSVMAPEVLQRAEPKRLERAMRAVYGKPTKCAPTRDETEGAGGVTAEGMTGEGAEDEGR